MRYFYFNFLKTRKMFEYTYKNHIYIPIYIRTWNTIQKIIVIMKYFDFEYLVYLEVLNLLQLFLQKESMNVRKCICVYVQNDLN